MFKKIMLLLLAFFVVVTIGCNKGNDPEEVAIKISASQETAKKGDVIEFSVEVTGTENKGYSWNISDPTLISIDINLKGTILKNVTDATELTITVTSNADETKSDSVVITVNPLGSSSVVVPSITITPDKTTVVKDDIVNFTVEVTNSEDKAYTLTSSNTEYVIIEDNKAKVIKEPTVLDQAVVITATLTSNPTVTASTSLTVKAPVIDGQVGELTTELLQKVGNPSITVNGVLTDYYEDFKNSSNNFQQSYDMQVLMEEGVWAGTWYVTGNPAGALTEVFKKGTETGVTDQYGNVGHSFLKSFINKDNEVENKVQIDYLSIPVVWEAQHLWNHLGNLNINKFTYDAENKVYAYNPTTEEDFYLLTYLSYCLTPLLSDTLVEVFLIIENGEITKLIGQTEQLLQYGESESEIDARSYTRIELEFSNVGTTDVPDPKPYAASEHADKLAAALEKMAGLKNYTFKVKDTTTSAPSSDEGDYSIETQSTSRKVINMNKALTNYTSSVGEVGRVGYVTEDAVLLQDTGKYSYTMDGQEYFIEYSGLKQNADNTYEEFEYTTETHSLAGTKLIPGNMFDAMPTFDFSPNVFELKKAETIEGVEYYHFQLREDAITRDIAMEICYYTNAKNAKASSKTKTTIVVTGDGYLVNSTFPYDITSGTYLGYCTTTYGKFNETSLPEGTFDNYVAREVKNNWSDYIMKYYYPTFSTLQPSVEIAADVVVDEIFGEDASKVPAPSIFLELFGDNISGPFYDWKAIGTDADGNDINRAHFTITVQASEYDENGNVGQDGFNTIANRIISTLDAEGFTLDMANSQLNSRNNRYICLVNDDVQIVIENNNTKYFWITFYVTGDWTLSK